MVLPGLPARHTAPADSLPPALRVGVRTTPRGRVRLDDRLEAAPADAVLEHGAAWVAVDAPNDDHFTIMPPVDAVTNPRVAYLRAHGRNREGHVRGRSVADRFAWRYDDAELEEIGARARELAGNAGPCGSCSTTTGAPTRRWRQSGCASGSASTAGAQRRVRMERRLTAAGRSATLAVNVRSSRESQLSPARRRVLVVANRTAATPDLLAVVTRHAREQPTSFTLLIPDAPRGEHADWTLELALPLLERAAGGRVQGMTGTAGDPFDAVRHVLREGRYELVLVSTLPRRVSAWLRRDLPKRIEALGVPVEVVTAPGRRPIQELLDDAARSGLPPAGLG